ncbi:MAG: glycosyltransferase family 2 protein [Hyphomicrobiaceae bacterium]|nr:glycosyltransferase family 2 protein [Hyphomicrobiaceae bacterium]
MSKAGSRPVYQQKIAAIIVNYKIADLAIEAIKSLEQTARTFNNFSVHIVDNLSLGDDVERLQKAIKDKGWQRWVTLHPQNKNLGFAAGNNVILRKILQGELAADYAFFLNPDACILNDAVGQMVQFLEAHPKAGIVGARLENEAGAEQTSAFHFPTILGEFEQAISLSIFSKALARWKIALPSQQKTSQVEAVSGACLMLRKEVLETIGLMDEGYFLYYEETDFMLQAHKAGWQTWHLHTASVLHLEGKSTNAHLGGGLEASPLPLYVFESWRYYFLKNHGRLYAATAGVARLSGAILYKAHRFILQRPSEQPANSVSSFWKHCLWPLMTKSAPRK